MTLASVNAGNESCPVYNSQTAAFGYSSGLKTFSVIYTVVVCVTIITSGVLWYMWRVRLHLARRFPALTGLMSFGVLVQTLFVGSLPRALDGDYSYPCAMYTGLFILVLPLVTWPITVRMVLHHNKIVYSRQLALENFEQVQAKEGFIGGGESPAKAFERSQEVDRLDILKFRTSNEYGAMVTLVPLILITVLSFVAGPISNCEACRELPIVTWTVGVLASFLGGSLLITAFNFAFLWAVRKDPDPLRLALETKYMWISALSVGVLGMILAYGDTGGFLKADPIEFTFYIFVDLSGFIFFCLGVPLQLFLSSRPVRQGGGELKKVLQDPNGRHYFGLYLATELSLENLMFYMKVKEWTSKYDELDQEARVATAVELYKTFVSSSGEHPVNISGDARTTIAKRLFAVGDSRATLTLASRKFGKLPETVNVSKKLDKSSDTLGDSNKMAMHASRTSFRKSVYFPSLGLGRFRSVQRLQRSDDIEPDVFDRALDEVLGLLASDCFPRFRKSMLYKQYLGIVDPNAEIL